MNTWVEPPPPKSMGCFAKGCLILLVFGLILAMACAAGVFWGFRHHSAAVKAMYWLTRTHSVADSPIAVPTYATSDEKIQETLRRWRDFELAVRAGRSSEIELTADDLNDLIASDHDTRGKMFAAVEDRQLRLQVSMPLGAVAGRSGYFLNGDIAVGIDGVQPLSRPRLSSISINHHQLPSDLLTWTYRSRRLGDYLNDTDNPWNATTAEIRDGKIILRSNGD